MPTPVVLANEALGSDLCAVIEELGYRLRVGSVFGDVLESAGADPPDLVVIGLVEPQTREAYEETCRWMLRLRERTSAPVVCIGQSESQLMLRMVKRCGVGGYLVRPVHPAQLRASIDLALQQPAGVTGPVLYDTARSGTYAIGASSSGVAEPSAAAALLSSREREVFGHLVEGRRVAEISELLFISRHTVRQHAKSIFRKLGMHSQVELMRRHGAQSARPQHEVRALPRRRKYT